MPRPLPGRRFRRVYGTAPPRGGSKAGANVSLGPEQQSVVRAQAPASLCTAGTRRRTATTQPATISSAPTTV